MVGPVVIPFHVVWPAIWHGFNRQWVKIKVGRRYGGLGTRARIKDAITKRVLARFGSVWEETPCESSGNGGKSRGMGSTGVHQRREQTTFGPRRLNLCVAAGHARPVGKTGIHQRPTLRSPVVFISGIPVRYRSP